MDVVVGPHCSKRVNTILPLQVEAETIKWALTLATNLEFEVIIIESNSQVCSNLLSHLEAAPRIGESSPFVMTLEFS